RPWRSWPPRAVCARPACCLWNGSPPTRPPRNSCSAGWQPMASHPSGAVPERREAPASLLKLFDAIRMEYGGDSADRKLRVMRALAARSLPSAAAVLRLHEILCFLRAIPDSPELLRGVESLLAGFHRRADLRRHRKALASSGIAGTSTHYPFFQPTASWL